MKKIRKEIKTTMMYLETDRVHKLKEKQQKMQKKRSKKCKNKGERTTWREEERRRERKREDEGTSCLFKFPREINPTAASPLNWSTVRMTNYSNPKEGDFDINDIIIKVPAKSINIKSRVMSIKYSVIWQPNPRLGVSGVAIDSKNSSGLIQGRIFIPIFITLI